jgi:hypothetical protein
VHAFQDAAKITQKNSGKFEMPNWDQDSQKKVRDALLVLASTIPDFRHAFGTKEEVDPIRHLIGTAAAWGGNPDKDATYLNVTPAKNDGTTIYKLKVKDVPVDGFWSISLDNAQGYFQKNAYTINNSDSGVQRCRLDLHHPHRFTRCATWTRPDRYVHLPAECCHGSRFHRLSSFSMRAFRFHGSSLHFCSGRIPLSRRLAPISGNYCIISGRPGKILKVT